VPALASSVAAALFFILAPGLTGLQNHTKEESSMDTASTEMKESIKIEGERESHDQMNASFSAEGDPSAAHRMTVLEPTAVYEEDLETYEALTYTIPDSNAQIAVPITVLVEKTGTKTWFEQFEETMPRLKEEEWGLMDYYPLNAKLSYDRASQTVNIDLPAQHSYGFGSAAETWFMKVLEETFPQDEVKRVLFSTNGEKGITLGNTGDKFELRLPEISGHAYLFFYQGEGPDGTPYIVPAGDSFNHFSEALEAMSVNQDELGLKASVPASLVPGRTMVKEDGTNLHLELPAGTILEESFIYSLEAIMLTAKSFGYEKLQIHNAEPSVIGPFNLNELLELPVGANKKFLD
jgi:hypothetical protein